MIHPDVFFLVGKEAGNLSKHIFVLIVCVYKNLRWLADEFLSVCIESPVWEKDTLLSLLLM